MSGNVVRNFGLIELADKVTPHGKRLIVIDPHTNMFEVRLPIKIDQFVLTPDVEPECPRLLGCRTCYIAGRVKNSAEDLECDEAPEATATGFEFVTRKWGLERLVVFAVQSNSVVRDRNDDLRRVVGMIDRDLNVTFDRLAFPTSINAMNGI
jgi:hypothetical protein